MTGEERYWLYRVAVETGLRASELRSLRRADLDLGTRPAVTVRAAYSKHRREDTVPFRPGTAAELREHVRSLAPSAQVFKLTPNRRHAAEMFRADLEVAGIPYRDSDDRVADFHCLRHTFITNLAAGGVHPKVAQALARHSTITLTMDRYSHTLHTDHSAALDVLPNLSEPDAKRARATGTTDSATPTEPQQYPQQLGRETARNDATGRDVHGTDRPPHQPQCANPTSGSTRGCAKSCDEMQNGEGGILWLRSSDVRERTIRPHTKP